VPKISELGDTGILNEYSSKRVAGPSGHDGHRSIIMASFNRCITMPASLSSLQSDYATLKSEAMRLAGELPDIPRRVAVLHNLYLDSHGNHKSVRRDAR